MILRDDLPPGPLAAQCIHAAGESAAITAPPPRCHAVALTATERELHRLEAKLLERGVRHAAIREPDAPYFGALVAIGIAPLAEGADRLVRHLPLVGKGRRHASG